MSLAELIQKIKAHALDLGFFRIGIAKAEPLDSDHLDEWLERGYHGEMAYMKDHRDVRLDPAALLPNAKSVLVAAMNYYTPFETTEKPDEGKISRYAWGDDYHEVLRPKLKELLSFIQELIPGANGRVCVDSAPIMEKVWAVRAGIGWLGKNANVLTRDFGSWFFLGEIILDVELAYDLPFKTDHCGTCTKCLELCPTNAIVQPRVVDATKCISYLTIELKAERPYPDEIKPRIGNLVFGCDICQDVCPWNKKFAQPTEEPAFQPRLFNLSPKLKDLAVMDIDEFREKFRRSPIKRAKLAGLRRNVGIALENNLAREIDAPGDSLRKNTGK